MIDSSMAGNKRLVDHFDFFDKQLNQKRQVRLKTCADVYEHWRAYKRSYKKAPKDGVEFQIDYIDTGLALSEEERPGAPVALALHGAPGSYHDFALLINHLTRQKVRVIAPNFPEYVATVKTKVLFRHSADEKAAYLRDFLKAIKVNKIDLLVSHSSAIFPTLLILLNANQRAIDKSRQRQARQPDDDQQLAEQQRTLKSDAQAAVELVSSSELAVDSNNNNHSNQGEIPELRPVAGRPQVRVPVSGEEAHECTTIKPTTTKTTTNPTGDTVQEAAKLCQHDTRPPNGGKRTSRRAAKSRSSEPIVRFEEPIEIKSVALFNPAGHRLPKSMKPTWFKCGSVHVYQHKFGRSLFRKFGPAFLTVVGVPVKVDNMDNVMLSATVMRNSKCPRVVGQLEQLSQLKIPTLLVFSENDKLIEKEIFYEMTQFMRLDPRNFDVFSNDGNIELSQSHMEDWIRVMVFKAGGHYAYSNYAKTVNTAVSELLKKALGAGGGRRRSRQ